MKRFWQVAAIAGVPGGYAVTLDGKPMRLPGGPELKLPRRALTEAVAAEWQAAGGEKGGEFALEDVPLTRLAGTAQHQIAPDPAPTIDAIAAYGDSDLLCYRAPHPDPLVIRQHHAWQPWLDWAAKKYGARLVTTNTIAHVPQSAAALAALHRAVAAQDAYQLAGLGIIVPAYGSLVLGLAVAEAALGAGEAHDLSVLDEKFQETQWGEDTEAAARREAVARDVAVAARFMALAAA
jgi:chaperone required for assembly of F1-ATPase